MPLPLLTSARVLLRPATRADADGLQRHWNRRAVRRYLWDGMPVLSSQVEAVLAQQEHDLLTRAVGLFTLRPVDAPDRIVGCVGLRSLAGETESAAPRHDLPPELFVSVDHSLRRQGVALRAAELVLQDAHARAGLREVIAVVSPANTAAVQGLGRLGFRPRPAIVILGAPMPAWCRALP